MRRLKSSSGLVGIPFELIDQSVFDGRSITKTNHLFFAVQHFTFIFLKVDYEPINLICHFWRTFSLFAVDLVAFHTC